MITEVVLQIVKICRACGVEKSLDEFHRNAKSRDGRTSYCKPCAVAKATAWQKANPEKHKVNARAAHVRRRDAGLVRNDKYRLRYDITVEQYESMYEQQSGCCLICKKHYARLHVDHRHEDGVVRGLLCNRCNQGIGFFFDSAELLRAAAHYVEA